MFKAVSLFSGIGGFDLAFESAGFTVTDFVEISAFNRMILRLHGPKTKQHEDIRNVEANALPATTDLVLAGVPCQPASGAGKRRGANDERWLWPDTLRIVGELRPRMFVAENVPGLRTLDNGDRFREIVGYLAGIGYAVEWFTWSASDVGAPQKRKRLFTVAYALGRGRGTHRINGMGATMGQQGESADNAPEITHTGIARGTDSGQPYAQRPYFKPYLDRAFAVYPVGLHFPAGPGYPQYKWEPRRLVERNKTAIELLKGLGNAVNTEQARPLADATWKFMCDFYR